MKVKGRYIAMGVGVIALAAQGAPPASSAEAQAQTEPPIIAPASPASTATSVAATGLNADIQHRWELLRDDPENGGRVTLTSGYRTPQEQQHQIDCYAAREPGCMPADPVNKSMHVKGAALDLAGPPDLRLKLAKRYGLYNPHKSKEEAHHFEVDPNAKPVGEK